MKTTDSEIMPQGYKMTEPGALPEEWEVVRLGEVAETYSGGTPSREQKKYFEGKIGWLRSGELNDNYIYLTQECITEEALKKSSAKYVENNTLLIAMYGATVGKVGLAKAKFTINQAICAVKLNEKLWSEFYFFGASGNSMGDMTEGRNLAILEAWKTKNSMRSY